MIVQSDIENTVHVQFEMKVFVINMWCMYCLLVM